MVGQVSRAAGRGMRFEVSRRTAQQVVPFRQRPSDQGRTAGVTSVLANPRRDARNGRDGPCRALGTLRYRNDAHALARALYRSKYGDRHLREQSSRGASEQKFSQPRVRISSNYEQVRSSLHGMRDDHLRDRRAVRHHAVHVEMHTMPRQLQCDVGTGLLPVSATSGHLLKIRLDF